MSDKPKQSSWLLNLIMLCIGIICILMAIMSYITPTPAWWPLTGAATAAFSAIISLPIGLWMFIAAVGLWQEQEWALGASWVVFTLIIANGFIGVAQGLMADPAGYFTLWPNVVAFIIVLVAVVGFIYLFMTMKRYH